MPLQERLLTVLVEVDAGDPVLRGYLMPLEGHDPASLEGAEIGTNVPSITDPSKLKNQLIESKVLPSQSSDGVKPPDSVSNAEVKEARV